MKRIIYILFCVLICIMMVLGSFGLGASTTASAADVNGDGKVEAEDALLILQYTVDKITSF